MMCDSAVCSLGGKREEVVSNVSSVGVVYCNLF